MITFEWSGEVEVITARYDMLQWSGRAITLIHCLLRLR